MEYLVYANYSKNNVQ